MMTTEPLLSDGIKMSHGDIWRPEFSTITFDTDGSEVTLGYSDDGGEQKLVVSGDKVVSEVYISDVIGAELKEGMEITIYNYPKVEPRCGRSDPTSAVPRPRRNAHIRLMARSDNPFLPLLVDCIRTLATGTAATRKFLVVVNPCSGKKKALMQCDQEVRPLFAQSNIDFDLLVTTHAGHATERMKEDGGDLSEYDGVIAVGGDGLLYEMMQGVQTRGDCNDLLRRMTFGIIPAGSGNGLAASIVHSAGEVDSILANTFVICKNGSKPSDLSLYETAAGNKYLSFLSCSWGIVADVDLESEVLRVLGPLRFDVYAVWRMLSLKVR
jgi:hypothetical protein